MQSDLVWTVAQLNPDIFRSLGIARLDCGALGLTLDGTVYLSFSSPRIRDCKRRRKLARSYGCLTGHNNPHREYTLTILFVKLAHLPVYSASETRRYSVGERSFRKE